jgi:hypothetical protein
VIFGSDAIPPDDPRYPFLRRAKDGTMPPQPASFIQAERVGPGIQRNRLLLEGGD